MRPAHLAPIAAPLFALVATVAACGSSESTPSPAAPTDAGVDATTSQPGADAHVVAFDKQDIYFAKDDHRTADAHVTFPATGTYSSVTMHLTLGCPNGRCDFWDRIGTIGVVQPAADGGADTVIEIARFITPYRVGATWDVDLTPLRPLLSGDVTLRAFIETWVGPGSTNGDGWLLSASFDMTGGAIDPEPIAVVPVWDRRSVTYGEPTKPTAASIPAATIDLDALRARGASQFLWRTFITGHGQGNGDNCAEFCARKHTLTAAGHAHAATVWRTDCAKTAAPNQLGTYDLSRAGWCPGATVRPWSVDVSADLDGVAQASLAYDVDAWVNSCRPGATADDAGTCSGCTLGTGCAYDGGNHTEPFYSVSSVLVAYR